MCNVEETLLKTVTCNSGSSGSLVLAHACDHFVLLLALCSNVYSMYLRLNEENL